VASARLDQELVRRDLARSRSEAVDLIAQGRVIVSGSVATKPAANVGPDSAIEVLAGPRFVGRGGHKLAAALEHFGIDPSGLHCLDVGAAAGGFTDCLLQRGAAHVTAVDVGTGQFAPGLRLDSRVAVHEGTDLREFRAEHEAFALVVVDVSFVSICTLASPLAELVSSQGLILVKPQFEVGREAAGRGVIHSQALRERAVNRVKGCLAAAGLDTVGVMDSPLPGERGNIETFLLVRP